MAGRTGFGRRAVTAARVGAEPAPANAAALRQKALRLLARRDYSRAELRRKLVQAGRLAAGPAGGFTDAPADGHEEPAPGVEALLDAVLDALEAERLLSDQRFAEGVARGRSSRLGSVRIAQTLKASGVDPSLTEAVLGPLRDSERDRALALWQRRFGRPASDLRERARQHRFLLGRGFDAATVGWVLKQAGQGGGDDIADADADAGDGCRF